MARTKQLLGTAAFGLAALAIFVAEKRRPLRTRTQLEPRRTLTNLALGALTMAAMTAVEQPLSEAAARLAKRRRLGLAQRLPAPIRDVAGFLLLDYATYGWHVLTHKSRLLWRLHLVHHVDLDMDTTTALRFHAIDMIVSAPARALQVIVVGASPRALTVWRACFNVSVLFHHSNLRLPGDWDRRLSWVFTTPGMHGIHHSADRALTDANWSSGLSVWDRLHGTFRDGHFAARIGVPAWPVPTEFDVRRSLALPFARQRDDWLPAIS